MGGGPGGTLSKKTGMEKNLNADVLRPHIRLHPTPRELIGPVVVRRGVARIIGRTARQ
jgi:hypothetical protein